MNHVMLYGNLGIKLAFKN